jgi:prepilin signal peptidase PulO-like enzyme (type II secretory pathway)
MGGEGFTVTCLLIGGFVIIALGGMALIFLGKADVDTLKEYFVGLGILAGLFGVPSAIQSWVQTRGQTSAQIIESDPLEYTTTFVGTDPKGE